MSKEVFTLKVKPGKLAEGSTENWKVAGSVCKDLSQVLAVLLAQSQSSNPYWNLEKVCKSLLEVSYTRQLQSKAFVLTIKEMGHKPILQVRNPQALMDALKVACSILYLLGEVAGEVADHLSQCKDEVHEMFFPTSADMPLSFLLTVNSSNFTFSLVQAFLFGLFGNPFGGPSKDNLN